MEKMSKNVEILKQGEFDWVVEKWATIEIIIFDRGGWAQCSSCGTKIDEDRVRTTVRCPNLECNKPLRMGETTYI